jgi:uncharacterized protein YbjT (DUF2867 family)
MDQHKEAMMARIIVLGGTGRTGRLLIEQLRAQGDSVVAVFRNPSKRQEIMALGAEPVILDLAHVQVADLVEAMRGGDAVIFAAGTRENEDNVDEIDRDAAIKSAQAAQQAGISRFVQISAMGVRTGIPDDLDDKMKAYYRAKRAGDQHLMSTQLDWTILEPGELTEESGTGHIKLGAALGAFGKIARADVAATAIAALAEPATVRHTFEVVSGDTPIVEALRQAAS